MQQNDPKLLTVILNWRTPEMTLKSAEAALADMSEIAGEITIVDNDSQDGSFEMLSRAVAERGWTRVRVLQSGHNGGFGAGNNVGIRAGLSDGSKPDFVYVLNSDAFPQQGAIKALVDYLQAHPKTGFAGSLIVGEDGVTHLTTFRFPSIASELEGAARFGPISRALSQFSVPLSTPAQTQSVDWVAGASLMMRRDVLDEVGLFDETFFLYFEETDLCNRVKNAGYSVVFVVESVVTHIGSVSTGMKEWAQTPGYWFDSRRHYFRKTHGRFYASLALMAHLAGGALHRVRCSVTGRKPSDPPNFLRDLIRHQFRPKPKPATTRATRMNGAT